MREKKEKENKNKDFDVELDDIDLDVVDEKKNNFVEKNFKNNEWYIGTCPF